MRACVEDEIKEAIFVVPAVEAVSVFRKVSTEVLGVDAVEGSDEPRFSVFQDTKDVETCRIAHVLLENNSFLPPTPPCSSTAKTKSSLAQ